MTTEQPQIQNWREMDILEVLEEFKRIAALSCTTEQLDAMEGLPSSLHTLLLNSIMPLRRLAGTPDDCMDLIPRRIEVKQEVAIDRVSLPRGFSDMLAHDRKPVPVHVPVQVAPPEPEPRIEPPKEPQPEPVAQARKPPAMTTKSNPGGRQWFIGNVLAAEVQYVDGIGHVCRKWTGKHVSNQKPYSTYDTAASEARSHADGVMYLLGLP